MINLSTFNQRYFAIQKFKTKHSKHVIYKNSKVPSPPVNPGILRVNSLKILGITIDNLLNFQSHISSTITACSQMFFALRTMRQHGLPDKALHNIFQSKILSKLLYASPAWRGFISQSIYNQIEAFLRKATKFNFYADASSDLASILDKLDQNLFESITNNPNHCLYYLLPPKKVKNYDLRKRGHDYNLPLKDEKIFINRCLFKYI